MQRTRAKTATSAWPQANCPQMERGHIPSLQGRSGPAKPNAWGLVLGKVGLDLLVHLDHSPQAPDPESLEQK